MSFLRGIFFYGFLDMFLICVDHSMKLIGVGPDHRAKQSNALEKGAGMGIHRHLPSGAKARLLLLASSARLKSCPFKTPDADGTQESCPFEADVSVRSRF